MERILIENRLNNFDPFSLQMQNVVKNADAIFNNTDYEYYNLQEYKKDVINYGLEITWQNITRYVLNNKTKNEFLFWDNFAELYEIGLELQDKQTKKKSGQYYTPDDIAFVMAEWLNYQNGENICDVACGTGKLILTYLDLIGKEKAIKLIYEGKVYLYDLDHVALNICKTILLLKYGKESEHFIHIVHCDFLSKKISLPENCKVISNPPYAGNNLLNADWERTDVSVATKELYAMFMEKIIKQSKSSVIITPYSFVGGNKFYSLRKIMNDYNGFIVTFDNVPGNIFCGRKYGVFNSNTSNSVRASITVVENKYGHKGFKTTPLIRFKNQERKKLLKTDILESFINEEYQLVDDKHLMYYKCAKELKEIWHTWQSVSNKQLGDYISQDGQNTISMPNTCRYYTTASNALMNRNGQIVLKIENNEIFDYLFCMINSSFAYWFWRMFDGGITYSRGLLLKMPVFYTELSKSDKQFFRGMTTKMIETSKKYIVVKNNIGVQENIKYPKEFRDKINRRLLDILKLNDVDEKIFDIVHKNCVFE